jgi:hypothetical protein
MADIGATLREARMRARIDVSEIEAQTKIRAKYLRALENEEWDLLPGPTFVKSFLRTYAQALGLDGRALVEDYRVHFEAPELDHQPPSASARRRARLTEAQPSRSYVILASAIGILIVLLIVGLVSGKGGGNPPAAHSGLSASAAAARHRRHRAAHGRAALALGPAPVALSLEPSAPVYVCLIGDGGRKVIPGVILQAGEHRGPYHARRFEVDLGNNAVTLYVDGAPVTVPPSSTAIGYSITKTERRALAPGRQPTCA